MLGGKRRFAKAAVALAVALQHRRSATKADAEFCLAATESVVRVVEILSGHLRDDESWARLTLEDRYFAWSGPRLHALEDRPPIPTPAELPQKLREAGMTPSFGTKSVLTRYFAQGRHQVFETDRKRWRRELLLSNDGSQVLLVRKEDGQ